MVLSESYLAGSGAHRSIAYILDDMTVQTVFQQLAKHADLLNAREAGFRWPEISDGKLVMMMSPSGLHILAATRIRQQIEPQAPDDYITGEEIEVEDPLVGARRTPDVIVIAEDALDTMNRPDPRGALLAVEVVSPSNPDNDYVGKLRDYPAMGIERYVIVDPRDGTVHHHRNLKGHGAGAVYADHTEHVFGDTVEIGDFRLDTARLKRYPQQP